MFSNNVDNNKAIDSTTEQYQDESIVSNAQKSNSLNQMLIDEGFSSAGHQNENAIVDTSSESNDSYTNKSMNMDKQDDVDSKSRTTEQNCDFESTEHEQQQMEKSSTSNVVAVIESDETQRNNMHRRFIRKSLDATNNLLYSKNCFIESDAIETEYPRNLDDNIELLSTETEFLEAQFIPSDDKFLQFDTAFDLQNQHQLQQEQELREDDYEPVGVSPCGRFFKYGK